MVSAYSTHPYVKWQLKNKEVPPFALNLQIKSDTSKNWKELVDLGIDIYKPDSAGFTPLHHALFHGNDEVSEYLLSISEIKKYPEINTGPFKLTIVDYAIFRKASSDSTIKLLEQKRRIERAPSPWCRAIERMRFDSNGLSSLMKCASFPQKEVPQMIHSSIKTNNLGPLKLLYEAFPYAMAADYPSSWLALKFACLEGSRETVESILKAHWKSDLFITHRRFSKHLSKEEQLIKLKVLEEEFPFRNVPFLFYKKNIFPLHWALKSNNQELIAFLLNLGVYVHGKDEDGKTPLLIAAEKSLRSTQKIIYMMCNYDAEFFSLKKLSKPIEVSNKVIGIFLKRVVKADKMHHFLAFSNVHWRIKNFIEIEIIFEKLQLIDLTNLNKDVINIIKGKFIEVARPDKLVEEIQPIYQI